MGTQESCLDLTQVSYLLELGAGTCRLDLPAHLAWQGARCAAAGCRRGLTIGTKYLFMKFLWCTLLVLGRDVMTSFTSADSAIQMDLKVPGRDHPWVWLIVSVSKMSRQ